MERFSRILRVARKPRKQLVAKKISHRVNPDDFADYDPRRTGASIFKNGASVSPVRPIGRAWSVQPNSPGSLLSLFQMNKSLVIAALMAAMALAACGKKEEPAAAPAAEAPAPAAAPAADAAPAAPAADAAAAPAAPAADAAAAPAAEQKPAEEEKKQ
jgi:hypothetical protein